VQVALLLAFATLPVGVLAVAQGYAAFHDTKSLRRTALAGEAFEQTSREQGLIREAFGALDALRSQIEPDMPVDACATRMRDYVLADDTRVSFAGVTGQDGVMRCGYPLGAPLDLRETPEYTRFVAAPRRMVTVYQKGAISGVPVVTVSAPIWRGEVLAGSIAVSVPSAYINWASAPERDAASRFAIVDSNGRPVARPDSEGATTWLPDAAQLNGMLDRTRRPMVATSGTGEQRIYSITPLFKTDIYAVSSWPEGRATGQLSLVNAIRIDTLLQEIVENARATRENESGGIALKFNMVPHIEDPDRALPLALFTVEAVANAFKHGLGRGGKRALRLTLSETEAEVGVEMMQLCITNVHRGIAGCEDASGLGSQLIDSFARQLRGTVDRTITDDRYTLTLTFPRAPSA